MSSDGCEEKKRGLSYKNTEKSPLVLGAGLEPAQPQWSQDFKSCVSTIPPSEQTLSGKRDSNPRPRPWQGRALPTELFPQYFSRTKNKEPRQKTKNSKL